MSTLTWLHISDLHFRTSQAYDANVVLRALLRDISERVEQDGLRPDFIAVTGDIAFSGQPAEYALAERFFDDLLATAELGQDRLFLVPGNHDIDRSLVTAGARAIGDSLQDRASVNAVLADPADRPLMMARFRHYAAFVNSYFGAQLHVDDKDYYYVRTFKVAGRRIALLGLNSAWLCASDEDKAKGLVLGERQARTVLEQAQDADIRIALLHHPFDQLREFDVNDVEPMLCAGCDFVLHGHLHRTSLASLKDPDAEAMVLSAGSCYVTRQVPNLYSFVRLDLATGTGTAYLRRFSDERGGFWAKDGLTYRNVPDGVYHFTFGRTAVTPPYKQRRVDAAVPGNARVGEHIDLLVQVRLPDSPLLGAADHDWPATHRPPSVEQTTETVAISFPQEPFTRQLGPARLKIQVVAPDFTIEGPGRGCEILDVPPDGDSKRILFLLTPTKPGICRINIAVHALDDTCLGTIPLQTTIGAPDNIVGPPMITAQLFLVVVVLATSQTSQATAAPASPANKPLRLPTRARRYSPIAAIVVFVSFALAAAQIYRVQTGDSVLSLLLRPTPTETVQVATPTWPAPATDLPLTAVSTALPTRPLPTLAPTRLVGTPPTSIAIEVTPLALYEEAASNIAWSPDSQALLIDGSILYDVVTGEGEQVSPERWGKAVFSPDGRLVAVATYDGVSLWGVSGRQTGLAFPGSRDTQSLAFAPDGTTLATGTGSTVKLWDVDTGAELWTFTGSSGRAVAFSPDGKILAAGGGVAGADIRLWNPDSHEELPALTGHSNWINSLAFSPDGELLASGSVDETVGVWDVATGNRLLSLTGHTGQVDGVAFSPDGRTLASASWDLTVRLWDVTSGRELMALTGPTTWIHSVAFSPDGSMLASGSADRLTLWRVE